MKPAYAVCLLAGVEREDRHGELLVVVIGVSTAQSNQVVPLNAQLAGILVHILVEESLLEVVVSCGDGCVAGVESACAYHFLRLVEGQALALHEVHHALQAHEGSVSLVAVVNIFLDTQFVQGEHTSDTEQNFLLDTVLPVAAVELVGDLAVPLGVEFVVGVQQHEVDTTYSHLPQVGVHGASGVGHINNHRGSVCLFHLRDGQVAEVLRLVVSQLLSLGRECLCEIAVAIEEADGCHIDIAVGCLFQVVAGEHSETTRVDFQNMGQTIFH